MCGIAGAVGTQDPTLIGTMVSALEHRGPDHAATVALGPVALGVSRLAIVDPRGGNQPIFNEDRSLCIVFNGEIYNHHELRIQLAAQGHRFFTHADTEVILHLYEQHGPRCVEFLRGMFCFAITDGRTLFLARDRVGIKPLYFTQVRGANAFLFASEIKSLLAVPFVPARIDETAATDWAVIGHPVGTRTLIEGIHLLGPGETLTLDAARPLAEPRPARYFRMPAERVESMSMDEAEDATLAALTDAVHGHSRTSDGRLGLVLSGGLDSTLLALLLGEDTTVRPRTYTVADHRQHPDVEQAESVADFIGSDHRTLIIGSQDFLHAIPQFVATEEMPGDMSAMPRFILNREIARDSKVCISGEGADELFGGYAEFVDRWHKAAGLKERIERAARCGRTLSAAARAYVEPVIRPSFFQEYLENLFKYSREDQLDRDHLHRVDKLGMAFGLENRVPFLDDRVVEVATSIPIRHLVSLKLGIRKHVLRRILIRRYGVQMLDIALREKLTFPSAGGQFMNRLGALCNQHVPDNFARNHRLGRVNGQVVRLVCFDLFEEIFVRHRGNAAAVGSFADFMSDRYGIREDAFAA